jgi:hypothetical protein
MNSVQGMVARTTKFKESATLPFVIPSEAEESAVFASQYRMLTGETVLLIRSEAHRRSIV